MGRDLPERLELPLASGEPWWYWLGGRPALDLVNTLRERWRRRVETLVDGRDLARWLVAAGLLDAEPAVAPAAALLDDARALREAIDACLQAALDREPVPAPAVAVIDGWLARGATRPRLALGATGAPALGPAPAAAGGQDPVAGALAAIALDAAQMLGVPAQARRIRVCASSSCSARFYDRSPAGRRRWCSMSLCGNQAKARRHRARHREVAA